MSYSPLRVGVVGTGIFASKKHLPAFEALSDKYQTSAAFNRSKAKALSFAERAGFPQEKVYESLEELLKDEEVDVIDALLPVQYNLEVVQKTVAAGKPIIFEKPVAANLEQARELVRLAEATDVPVAVAENWLFLDYSPLLKEQVGRIGEIIGFSYNYTAPFVEQNEYMSTEWRKNPEHIGGPLSDGGVHPLALLTDVLGEVGSVAAFTKQVRERSNAPDVLFSALHMRSGAVGTFIYGSAFGSTDKWIVLKIFGVNGSVHLDISNREKAEIRVIVGSSAENKQEEQSWNLDVDDSYGVKGEFLNFYEAVINKDKDLVKGKPRVAFHQLACVDAFLKSSSKGGARVEVEIP